jgi:chromosome segregation ATPase
MSLRLWFAARCDVWALRRPVVACALDDLERQINDRDILIDLIRAERDGYELDAERSRLQVQYALDRCVTLDTKCRELDEALERAHEAYGAALGADLAAEIDAWRDTQ